MVPNDLKLAHIKDYIRRGQQMIHCNFNRSFTNGCGNWQGNFSNNGSKKKTDLEKNRFKKDRFVRNIHMMMACERA